MITRLAALLMVIALSSSVLAECAGWQQSAEARMACCAHGNQCPMQPADNATMLTQSQADACCALSEDAPSTPSSTFSIAPVTFAVSTIPVVLVLPASAPLRHDWHTLVPIDSSPIPRHLLLSVFLV